MRPRHRIRVGAYRVSGTSEMPLVERRRGCTDCGIPQVFLASKIELENVRMLYTVTIDVMCSKFVSSHNTLPINIHAAA